MKTSSKEKTVRFTLASARDSEPTVTAERLGLRENFETFSLPPEIVKVTLRSKYSKRDGSKYEVRFRLNRIRKNGNATYIALNWPKQLSKPTVGNPIEAKVLKIKA